VNAPAALPQFVRDLLAGVPRHGEGVHRWLFRAARVLHPYRAEDEIAGVLGAAVHDCGRPVTAREITDAIRAAKPFAWQPGQPIVVPSIGAAVQWPAFQREQREAITAGGKALADLWEASPVRMTDDGSHTEALIDALFPGNPWLCVGESQRCFRTRHREELHGGLSRQALIVPSPMTARTGRTREGRESEHTLASTGPRRFLVVEFDTGTADEHAALLLHLAQHAPLALAVHSAGKSLHGWFYCAGQPEDTTLRFMRYAVSLGADSHLWLRSQFARMPDGLRDNGKRQTVYFFNPASIHNLS
jgi:hypothetical protein